MTNRSHRLLFCWTLVWFAGGLFFAWGQDTAGPIVDVTEVLIGYFGPSDPEHETGGDLWLAASLAIEEENAAGGYKGLPFRLISGWSENPWGSGISQVTRMAYEDRVWAIVGSIDGSATHLAEQVVAKARLVLLNPGSTDKTVNLANVSWMFSCLPADDLQVPVLAEFLIQSGKGKPLTILSASDHDSRGFAREFSRYISKKGVSLSYHFVLQAPATDPPDYLNRIDKDGQVLLIGDARASVHLLKHLTSHGFQGQVFGTASIGRRFFLESAGKTADGIIFPDVVDCSSDFGQRFQKRYERAPDYAACQTYDAVRLLSAAIRKAGLDRDLIRDALRQLSSWKGAAGIIRWDSFGQNQRPVSLATIREGKMGRVSSSKSQIP